MGRPSDCTPLAGSDPIPGDPAQVAAEAHHLSNVAQDIEGQVRRLRAIASDHSLTGQYADKLRSVAGDVANSLGKVLGRYQKTSSTLDKWVPELEHAQSESLKALAEAQDAYYRQQRFGQPVMRDPSVPETDQQRQADQARRNALHQADQDLAAAYRRLDDAVHYRDSHGRARANEIRHAIDDDVSDSWWDDMKEFVHRSAWLLKDVCTALEIVATILAVIALFVPGLNILVILGIAATALALLGRGVLAANGDGSWTDVALDALALLTFGIGRIAGSAMRGTYAAAEKVARGLVQAERDASLLGKAGNFMGRAAQFVQNNPLTKVGVSFFNRVGLGQAGMRLAGLTEKTSGLLGKASIATLEKASPSLEKTLATVSAKIRPLETALYGGEADNLMLSRKMAAIARRFPESPEIARLSSRFATELNFARGNFGLGLAADLGDKGAGGVGFEGPDDRSWHSPSLGFYTSRKESWKSEGGVW